MWQYDSDNDNDTRAKLVSACQVELDSYKVGGRLPVDRDIVRQVLMEMTWRGKFRNRRTLFSFTLQLNAAVDIIYFGQILVLILLKFNLMCIEIKVIANRFHKK